MAQDSDPDRSGPLELDDAAALRFLRNIINSVPDPIFIKDRRHHWIELNRAFSELIGHPRGRLLGKSDYEFLPKEQADVFWAVDDEVFRTGREIVNEEVITTGGVTRILSTKKSTFEGPLGETVLVGIIRDITEQREAERRSREVSAKFATLGEMAGSIAHEISTPLSVIQGLVGELVAQTLEQAVQTEEDRQDIEAMGDEITSMVERVASIIRGLRTFARDGRQDPFQVVTLGALCAETLGICRDNLRTRGIRVDHVATADEVSIRCRPVQICQILLNLLNNARDAMEQVDEPRIELRTVADDDGAEIRVVDYGPGVPDELLERIMEPYFTTKPVGTGTGIGLSIAKQLAEQNGGTLRLDRQHPRTCFVLRFERVEAAT